MRKGKKRILVVDDEKLIREMYAEYLEQNDFIAISVESAEKALTLIREEEPDLVLVDVVMKNMSGIDLYNQTRLFNREIKFIFMTGYSHDDDIIQQLEKLKVDWFSKPVELNKILELIRKSLNIN